MAAPGWWRIIMRFDDVLPGIIDIAWIIQPRIVTPVNR